MAARVIPSSDQVGLGSGTPTVDKLKLPRRNPKSVDGPIPTLVVAPKGPPVTPRDCAYEPGVQSPCAVREAVVPLTL